MPNIKAWAVKKTYCKKLQGEPLPDLYKTRQEANYIKRHYMYGGLFKVVRVTISWEEK